MLKFFFSDLNFKVVSYAFLRPSTMRVVGDCSSLLASMVFAGRVRSLLEIIL